MNNTPSYEELLAKHERQTSIRHAQAIRYRERKKQAGLKQVRVWIPETVCKKAKEKKQCGIVFLEEENLSSCSVLIHADGDISIIDSSGVTKRVSLKQKLQSDCVDHQIREIQPSWRQEESSASEHPAITQACLFGAKTFRIAIHNGKGKFIGFDYDLEGIKKNLSFLESRNLNGSNIYIRPRNINKTLVMVNNITEHAIWDMNRDGFEPSFMIELSPGHYQVWVQLLNEYMPNVITQASRWLAKQYNGDLYSANENRFGALAGFYNHTPKYLYDGKAPMCKLVSSNNTLASSGKNLIQFVTGKITENKLLHETALENNVSLLGMEYRKMFYYWKEKRERLKRVIVSDHGDFYICCKLFRMDWTREQIEIAMKEGSPNLLGKKDIDGYIQRTIASAYIQYNDEKQSDGSTEKNG